MLLVGCGSSVLTRQARSQVYRFAAVLVIVLGVITLARHPRRNRIVLPLLTGGPSS